MTITVFGASGATGHRVVERALALDHAVRAFVRTPAKLQVTHPRLEKLTGDVSDASAVRRAVAGSDAVISTLGVGKPLQHDQAVIDGVGQILRAMDTGGVRRLVYLGFTGIDKRGVSGILVRPIVHYLLRHEIADHDIKEDMVRASSLDWTILHAPKLNNGRPTDTYRVGVALPRRSFFPIISRVDVSTVLVALLTDRASVRQVVDVQP
jgi:putative NADH-flavin reductase